MKKILGLLALGTGAGYYQLFLRRVNNIEPKGEPYQIRKKPSSYEDQPNKHFLTINPQSIGIIGAGISGIITAKVLKEQGYKVEVIEKNQGSGGVWYSNYDGAGLQAPSITYSIPDFMIKRDYPLFPLAKEIKDYFDDFINHFKFGEVFNYGKEVLDCQQLENGTWQLKLSDGETKTYDFLVVAGGMYNKPFIPNYQNLDTYQGTFMHSSQFQNTENLVKGKKVVVIGSSKSAIDIVYKCQEYKAEKIYWVKRGASHIFSKRTPGIFGEFNYFRMFYTRIFSHFNLFPDENCQDKWYDFITKPIRDYLWNRHDQLLKSVIDSQLTPDYSIKETFHLSVDNRDVNELVKQVQVVKGNVSNFTPRGIQVADQEIDADLVVSATGFTRNFIGYQDDEQDGPCLYRFIIKPGVKNLASIGYIQGGKQSTIVYMQAIWLAEVLRGKVVLPSNEIMLQDIDKRYKFVLNNLGHRGFRYGQWNDVYFIDPLLDDMGIEKYRAKTWYDEIFQYSSPASYEAVVTHLV